MKYLKHIFLILLLASCSTAKVEPVSLERSASVDPYAKVVRNDAMGLISAIEQYNKLYDENTFEFYKTIDNDISNLSDEQELIKSKNTEQDSLIQSLLNELINTNKRLDSLIDSGGSIVLPSQPQNLTSNNITFSSVDLGWDDSDAIKYDVYQDGSLLGSTESSSYNVTSLKEQTQYSFYVVGKDAQDNESISSDTVTITTLASPPPPMDLKAFPEAYGVAAEVTGGRNGSLYHVTNLNNSGSGSFRDAVSQSNRTIVFDVSGTIELTSSLFIYSDNLSVYGQSAPQGGITITGEPVFWQANDNVIVRHVRFRPNYTQDGVEDAMNASNITNCIFDHLSISWGGDEAFSQSGSSNNITVQNSILAESKTGMICGQSSTDYGSSFSVIGNLFYNISHRFPNVTQKRTDIINNVVHNWFTRLSVTSSNADAYVNEIGNYYQWGVKTNRQVLNSNNISVNWLDIRFGEQQRVYTDDNVYPDLVVQGGDNWELYVHRFDVNSGQYAGTKQWEDGNLDFRVYTPHTILGISPNILTGSETILSVPQNAGANKYIDNNGVLQTEWDAIDNLYRGHVINNTSVTYDYPPTTVVNKSHYISFHNSVSSTPINTRPASYDTDNDGMCDNWEIKTFGNLNKNGSEIETGHVYNNLERFLNGI